MARFQGKGKIQEERQFTNPAVRFVRIRGRVVPIFNKKRIGQLTEKSGNKALAAGAAVTTFGGAVALAKRSKTASKFKSVSSFLGSTSFGKAMKKDFARSRRKDRLIKSLTKPSMKRRAASVVARAASKPFRFTGKHPLAVGLTLVGAGFAARFQGANLQAKSNLGFDILPEFPGGQK